jgi:GntR family transcriptional regulator
MYEQTRHEQQLKFLWISDCMQQEINSGLYNIGDPLPSEAQLCERFKVNRYTVRQALEFLVRKGIIRSQQGKGYYICHKPFDIQYSITPGMRFSEEIRKLGKIPRAHVLDKQRTTPPACVAEALRLAADEPVIRLEILRFADEIPIALNVTWLPEKYVPGLYEHISNFHSLHTLLKEIFDVEAVRVSSLFEAIFPTLAEINTLHITPNTTLLHIKSVMRDERDHLIEYTSAKYRGDLCKVSVRFE